MNLVIVDLGSGNLRSAAKAFERMGADQVRITRDPEVILAADRLVLPGQGAFADCRRGFEGVGAAVTEAVRGRGRPLFGICVGMQILAEEGLEHGTVAGLGWVRGQVAPLRPMPGLKIPHMGWNELTPANPHPVTAGIEPGSHAYFVHSYHLVGYDPADLLATTDYGGPVTAIIGRDTMVGTQFHAEKSQEVGLRLIGNFLSWRP